MEKTTIREFRAMLEKDDSPLAKALRQVSEKAQPVDIRKVSASKKEINGGWVGWE